MESLSPFPKPTPESYGPAPKAHRHKAGVMLCVFVGSTLFALFWLWQWYMNMQLLSTLQESMTSVEASQQRIEQRMDRFFADQQASL